NGETRNAGGLGWKDCDPAAGSDSSAATFSRFGLSIQLTGKWLPGEVGCRWSQSSFHAPHHVMSLIEQAWRRAQGRKGTYLFDGPMCRLESFGVQQGRLELALSATSYKLFHGTNLCHAELADRYGPTVLANPLGISCAVVSSDGYLMLG